MPQFKKPRGTRDFGPEEMAQRRYVEEKMRETARLFGFGEVMTPTFESTELFTEKSGEDIIGELYAFEDKGGRSISLRPELTASVMRFYVNDMQSLPKPVKVFYFGNMFRYERPQAGRYREFWQFGAELIGAPSIQADAEVLALAFYMAQSANAAVSDTRIGHLGVLEYFFEQNGIDKSFQTDIRRYLDKKDFDGLEQFFSDNSLSNEALVSLKKIAMTQCDADGLDEINELLGGDCIAINYLKQLDELVRNYGIGPYSFDLGVARGLDYYTGMVFELDGAGLGAESQICGGGSYSLAELFGGQEVTSTGFAFGFDRVMLARKGEGDEIKGLDAYIIPIGEAAGVAATSVLMELRNAGICADMDLMGRNMGKAMKYANSIGARSAIIIGERELEQNSATIKDMNTGSQETVPIKDIVSEIDKIVG